MAEMRGGGLWRESLEVLFQDLSAVLVTPGGLAAFGLLGVLAFFLCSNRPGHQFLYFFAFVSSGTFLYLYALPGAPPAVQRITMVSIWTAVSLVVLAFSGFTVYFSAVRVGDSLLERWAARHGLPLRFSVGSRGAYRALYHALRLPVERREIFAQLLEDRLSERPLRRPEDLLPLLRMAAAL